MAKGNDARLAIYLSKNERDIFKAEAKKRGISFNQLIIKALRKIIRDRIPVLDQLPLDHVTETNSSDT